MGNLQIFVVLLLLPASLIAESPLKSRAPQVTVDPQEPVRSGSVKGAPFFGVKGRRPPSTVPPPTTPEQTDPPSTDLQEQDQDLVQRQQLHQQHQQEQQQEELAQRQQQQELVQRQQQQQDDLVQRQQQQQQQLILRQQQQHHQQQEDLVLRQQHHQQQQQEELIQRQQQQQQQLINRQYQQQQQQQDQQDQLVQRQQQHQQQQQDDLVQRQHQQQQEQYPQFFQLSEQEKQEQIERADSDLNKHLREAMEQLKIRMRSGMAEADYEVLDPLNLEDMKLKPMVAGEEFDVRMRRLTLGGLSGFDVTQLESQLSESRVKLGLYFPKLYANCLFDANGTLYDIFKVTGKGNATLIFKEVHARTVIYLSKENGSLRATSADQPYVDFSSAEILFRDDSVKGSEPIKAESVATQLGPLYFWVLTANAVEKIDYPLALYLNNSLRQFPLPQALQSMLFRQRYLRVHVPNHPIPYAYVSPELSMQPQNPLP